MNQENKTLNTRNHWSFVRWMPSMRWLSGALVLISLASLLFFGLNLGIDFTGGVLIEVHADQPIDQSQLQQVFLKNGFSEVQVQSYGTPRSMLVRLPPAEDRAQILENDLHRIIGATEPAMKIERVEYVGPRVGSELKRNGITALVFALLAIMIYVALRFEIRFSMAAVLALFHDIILVLGAFSLFRWNFDLSILAALLAVIGYSLNDTIVIFDHIRESLRTIKRLKPGEVINIALNQTLSRTLVTSLTTLLVLMSLLIFGGGALKGFAIALSLGVVFGTYSSIFVASDMAILLGVRRDLLMSSESHPRRSDDGAVV